MLPSRLWIENASKIINKMWILRLELENSDQNDEGLIVD